MKSFNGTLQFSPSDVIRFLDGNFAAWMDRRHFDLDRASTFVPDDATEEEKLVRSAALLLGLNLPGYERLKQKVGVS